MNNINLSPLEQAQLHVQNQYRRITHVALLLRMNAEERKAIKDRRLTDDEVEDIMFIMEKAEYVDFDDPVTIGSLYKLYEKGLFVEGRVETILSAEIQDRERPGK